jgi:hypothetical protein
MENMVKKTENTATSVKKVTKSGKTPGKLTVPKGLTEILREQLVNVSQNFQFLFEQQKLLEEKEAGQTVLLNEIREEVDKILPAIHRLQEIVEEEMVSVPAEPVPPPASLPASPFEKLKEKKWFGTARFIAIFLAAALVYNIILVPLIKGTFDGKFLPSVLKPAWDINTPEGAAAEGVSREPFRSDAVSRKAFGEIFDGLDRQVRDGALTGLEGYYNEFGKQFQYRIASDKYNDWADFWNNISKVALRSSGAAGDVKAYNDALQKAARVVAGYSGTDTPLAPRTP